MDVTANRPLSLCLLTVHKIHCSSYSIGQDHLAGLK